MATVGSARRRSTRSAAMDDRGAPAPRGEESQRLEGFLKPLCEQTRLRILLALNDGPKTTSEISERLGQDEPEIGRHLAVLRASRVAELRRRGRETLYQLTEPGFRFLDSARRLLDEADPPPEPRFSQAGLKKLIKKIGTVIDDPEGWLNAPNPRFEGRRPIDLIGRYDEVRLHIIIEALEQGCFS
jgi:DNA-binding transcriptional ArsR family regulator